MKVGLLERFASGVKCTLPENIAVCTAAALAGTFYFYEYYYGERLHTAACLAITALIAVIWLVCSVCSGRDRRVGFIVFSFLYWGAPYVYILWYGTRDNLHDYNKWLAAISKAAKALLYNPFYTAAEKLGSSPAVLASVLLIFVMAGHIAGYLLYRAYEKRKETSSDTGTEENEDEIKH